MKTTVGDIAALVEGTVRGEAATEITGVNGVEEAGPGDLCFIRGARWLSLLEKSQASAALIQEAPADCAMTFVEVDAPDVAFGRVLQQFSEASLEHPRGIHPSAVVGENVQLGEDIALSSGVHIADGCVIGGRVILYPNVYIGRNCVVGSDCVFFPGVVLREETTVGARCVIHANSTLGTDGFGYTFVDGRWVKIPQVGRVVLGDDVEIGSNSTIDRATFGLTLVGDGTKIDNQVQVGHNVHIGNHCVIAALAGIAGSAVIKNNVRIGAQSGINGHIEIGDGVTVGARGGVTASVEPGKVISGFPAIDHNLERKVMVARQRVPDLLRRVKRLERRVRELENGSE